MTSTRTISVFRDGTHSYSSVVFDNDRYLQMEATDEDGNGNGEVRFVAHLADGTQIERDTPFTEEQGYNREDRLRIMKKTQDAVHSRRMKLVWGDEGGETEKFDDEAREYMLEAFDNDFYDELFKGQSSWKNAGVGTSEKSGARGVIYQLAVCYLMEQSVGGKLKFGKYGGMWSCGGLSGVWTDFLLAVKCRDNWGGPSHYFIGIRLTVEAEPKSVLNHFNPNWKPTFTMSQIHFFKTAPPRGLTTVLFPNFGNPFTSKIEVVVAREQKEREEEEKKERKRERKEAERQLARDAQMAKEEELRRQKEYAQMEEELDETIIAYNASVKRVKDLITFNREKVATPLARRIEAKEAERQREEAERRHAEKLKQKEMERLAKFAPVFKKSSK